MSCKQKPGLSFTPGDGRYFNAMLEMCQDCCLLGLHDLRIGDLSFARLCFDVL